ncbi:MAG: hypothetical protein AB7G75_05745 [Candidatus Binatia bacterium]
MARSPLAGVITAAVTLIAIAVWLFHGSATGREASSAIIQAQQDIAAVHEIHSNEVDQETLRAAEADLLTATTAFGKGQFDNALEAAHRASRAAQQLLAPHSPVRATSQH